MVILSIVILVLGICFFIAAFFAKEEGYLGFFAGIVFICMALWAIPLNETSEVIQHKIIDVDGTKWISYDGRLTKLEKEGMFVRVLLKKTKRLAFYDENYIVEQLDTYESSTK